MTSPLYFSRLVLNERNAEVRRDLANCHRLHARILRAFPQVERKGNAREQFGILYRLESPEENSAGWCLLVQSTHESDWSTLPGAYSPRAPEIKRVDPIYDRIVDGMVLRFRLRANPTKRVWRKGDERWHGRRVALRREEEQIEWLQRKGEQGGFSLVPVRSNGRVVDVRSAFEPDVKGRRRGRRGRRVASSNKKSAAEAITSAEAVDEVDEVEVDERQTFGSTLFEGFLQVVDASRFRHALEHGIGSGKAFGFGLLSIAPTRSG